MSDRLTSEERKLIDEAVSAGRVTRVPYGLTSHGGYAWDFSQNALRRVVKADPKHTNTANFTVARARLHHNMKVAAEKRSETVLGLVKGGKAYQQIADLVGINKRTVVKIVAKLKKDGKL